MQRRKFILALGGAAVAWPLAAHAQQPAGRVYRIGYLSIASREQTLHFINAVEEGLRSLGYRVGENVVIEYRSANGELERLPALAADLVRLAVDVIVTGVNASTVAAMKATTTIPIVMTNVTDPVSAGFVASLARPGGNVTGFALDTGGEILGKRFELLKETLPNLSRVGGGLDAPVQKHPALTRRETGLWKPSRLVGRTIRSKQPAREQDTCASADASP